jgi:hypothetical protein
VLCDIVLNVDNDKCFVALFIHVPFILFSSQIILRLGTILPNGANLFASVFIRAVATSLVALGGYTLMYLAQMAAEVELDAFHTTTRAINTLRRNLVGVIHLAPFLRNLDAHLVVVLHRGNTSLAGLAVDATACNHLIHNSFCFIHAAKVHVFVETAKHLG